VGFQSLTLNYDCPGKGADPLKTKTFLTPFFVLLGLVATGTSAFFLGRLFFDFEQVQAPGMPPFSRLELPPQTMNGFTTQLESYYADASRLAFVVRVNSEQEEVFLNSISIKEKDGKEINAGYGVGPYLEPSTFMIDFFTAHPFSKDHLDGQLAFKISKPGELMPLADFQFDPDIPVYRELMFNPK
jgi:hypothetical protein